MGNGVVEARNETDRSQEHRKECDSHFRRSRAFTAKGAPCFLLSGYYHRDVAVYIWGCFIFGPT